MHHFLSARSRLRALLLGSLVTFVAGCANKANEAPVPPPGRKQILQVYILQDAAHPLRDYWGFPPNEALASGLGARVESTVASDAPAAAESLRVWSARPVDMLVLGPGLPAQAWAATKLAKIEGRKVVLVGAASADPEVTSLTLDEGGIRRFVTGFCARHAPKGSHCGTPDTVDIRVKWIELLKDVRTAAAKPEPLGFFSGFVEAVPGEKLTSPESVKAFEAFRKDAMLQALSTKSSKAAP